MHVSTPVQSDHVHSIHLNFQSTINYPSICSLHPPVNHPSIHPTKTWQLPYRLQNRLTYLPGTYTHTVQKMYNSLMILNIYIVDILLLTKEQIIYPSHLCSFDSPPLHNFSKVNCSLNSLWHSLWCDHVFDLLCKRESHPCDGILLLFYLLAV